MEKVNFYPIAQAIFNEARKDGHVDLSLVGLSGSYLYSKSDIKSEDWYQEEHSEIGGMDADEHECWLITDDWQVDWFDTVDSFADFLQVYRCNMPERFIPIYSVGVSTKTPSSIFNDARACAAEIIKSAGDQGYSSEYDWFVNELKTYSNCIGFEYLYAKINNLFELSEEDQKGI